MSSAQSNAANWWENDPIVEPARPAASAPTGGNWWENDPIVTPAQAQGQPTSTLDDVAMSAERGILKGATETAMLPLTVPRLAHGLLKGVVNGTMDKAESGVRWALGMPQVSPEEQARREADASRTAVVTNAIDAVQGAVRGFIDRNTHRPQTVPGQYAETLGEFAGGGLLTAGTVPQRVAQVVVPALASETAGQAFKGSPWEPYWRAGGAVLGGLGVAAWQAPKNAQSVLADNVAGITEAEWNAAKALQARGAEQGVNLTLGEALNQVTGGRAQNITRLERVVANSGDDAGQIMNDLYAARPRQVERAARTTFDDFGPVPANPHMVGPQVGEIAEGIVGDAMSARTQAVGPMYRAAAADTVDPAAVQAMVRDIDAMIARDTTGLTHGPLRELRESLVARPATPATPGTRTPVIDPKTGKVIRYNHTPGTPGTPEVLATDVENLDRARKYFRDKTELPQFSPNAIDKETGALVTGKTAALDQAMEAASPNYAAGKAAYQDITRKDIEPLLAGPLGQIAKRDTATQTAINALFPKDPLPGSSQQTFEAIKALSAQKPIVANQLVRSYVEQVFNRTAKELTGGPNVNGGARFVTELMGNSEKAANMRAAIRGLKNGDDILPGFERLMETLEATRWRPAPGSATAFNQQVQKELAGGAGKASTVVEHITTGGLRLPKAIGEKWTDWRAGRNTEALARILTDPKAVPAFKALATATPGSAKAAALAARLTYFAEQGLKNGNGNR